MSDLQTATLGRTGVDVTTLGFGAMELRNAADGEVLRQMRRETHLGA